jgi:hypothetical protein
MTIIIALAHEDGVTLGADRLTCAGQFRLFRNKQKWIVNTKGLALATSGAAEIQTILEQHFIDGGETDPYVFCSMLRAFLWGEVRWEPDTSIKSDPPCWPVWLLLTDGEKIWEAGNTLYPFPTDPGDPAAIGGGFEFAMGAMHAVRYQPDPKDIVAAGLKAAIHYYTGCGGAPWIQTITKKEK